MKKCPICKEELKIKAYETNTVFSKRITCGEKECTREYRIRGRIGLHAPAFGKWNIKYLDYDSI